MSGSPQTVTGTGNGPIAAFVDALRSGLGVTIDVVDYAEHARRSGRRRHRRRLPGDHRRRRDSSLGVGVHQNIITASLRAVLSALARHRAD